MISFIQIYIYIYKDTYKTYIYRYVYYCASVCICMYGLKGPCLQHGAQLLAPPHQEAATLLRVVGAPQQHTWRLMGSYLELCSSLLGGKKRS